MSRTRAQAGQEPLVVSAEHASGGAGGDTRQRLAAAVEAILLTTDKPVSEGRLAEALELGPGGAEAVRGAIASLNRAYESTARAFRAERVAGGWRMTTTPEAAEHLATFHQRRASTRLSRAAIETLAIIAYRQPIARSQIDAIRGVSSGEVLRALLERDLVAIVGRAEELGRPMLYGATRRFLEVFGLSSLKDLPPVDEADQALQASQQGAQDAGETAAAAHAEDFATSDAAATSPDDQADAVDETEGAHISDEERDDA